VPLVAAACSRWPIGLHWPRRSAGIARMESGNAPKSCLPVHAVRSVFCLGKIRHTVTTADEFQTSPEVRLRLDSGQSSRSISGSKQAVPCVLDRGSHPTITTVCVETFAFAVTWLPKILWRRGKHPFAGPFDPHCKWRKCSIGDCSLFPDHRCLAAHHIAP